MLTERERSAQSADSYFKLLDAAAMLEDVMLEMNRLLWLGEPGVSPGDDDEAGPCVATATVGVFGAEAVWPSTVCNLERFGCWVELLYDLLAQKGWRLELPRSGSQMIALAQRDDFRGAFFGSEFDSAGIGHMVSIVPNWVNDEGLVEMWENKSWLLVDAICLKNGEVMVLDEEEVVGLYATSVISDGGQRAAFVVLAGDDDEL